MARTKKVIKILDRQRKAQKNNNELKDTERTVKAPDNESVSVIVDKRKNYIVCPKITQYGSQYVNNLYSMVPKTLYFAHLNLFALLTTLENPPAIKTISPKHIGVRGWWYKHFS